MQYDKKYIEDKIGDLDNENYLKILIDEIADDDQTDVIVSDDETSTENPGGTPSYVEWLKKKGYIDADAEEYRSKSAEIDYNQNVENARNSYSQALARAEKERMDASLKANNAYLQSVSSYGNTASYLDRLGYTDGGGHDYYLAEAYRKLRDESTAAQRNYQNALFGAEKDMDSAVLSAEYKREAQNIKENNAYLKLYDSEMQKIEKEAQAASEKQQKKQASQDYYADMNDYYYRYKRDSFDPHTVYQNMLSGKLNREYYDSFVELYNNDISERADELFSDTDEENTKIYNDFLSDPLLNDNTRELIAAAYDRSSGENSVLIGKILGSNDQNMLDLQGEDGTEFEKLMPFIRNMLGEKASYIGLVINGQYQYFRVAQFDLLGVGNNRKRAEEYIKSASHDGKAAYVTYAGRSYITDGKTIFRLSRINFD